MGMEKNTYFGFEQLDVYQRAIEFVSISSQNVVFFPRGQAALADQFRRASFSIPLNIAEGTGRTTDADIQRCRAIARGSAMECAAILDVCRALGLVSPGLLSEAKHLLLRIVQMLSKLCR
jgi:four helix bundle protein